MMETIAFLRYKNASKDKLQAPDLIVQYAKVSLFPEGFHKAEDGFEFLPEDKFQVELDKNPIVAQRFQEELAAEAKALVPEAENELIHEFEMFKRWKRSKKGGK